MLDRLNLSGPKEGTVMNRSRGAALTMRSLAITQLLSVAARAQGPAAMRGGASSMPQTGGFGGHVPYRPESDGGCGVVSRESTRNYTRENEGGRLHVPLAWTFIPSNLPVVPAGRTSWIWSEQRFAASLIPQTPISSSLIVPALSPACRCRPG
jgi:hypothetical protein